jgi:protein tyrosine/serine phosphatase
MRITFPAALALLAFITLPLTTQGSSSGEAKDLPSFSQVAPGLLRGGQPTERGLRELKGLGVKTIISLRHNHSQVDWEHKQAELLGMNFRHLPMDGLHKIPSKTISDFLKIVENPVNQPVFVHCEYGLDRTGSLIAIYREEVQHWSAKHAYDEMVSKGFEKKYFWLADSVFDYEEDKVGTVSNQRPANVKLVDSLQVAIGTRPNRKSRDE